MLSCYSFSFIHSLMHQLLIEHCFRHWWGDTMVYKQNSYPYGAYIPKGDTENKQVNKK